MQVSQVVELPEREAEFVRYIVIDGMAPTNAAKAAGYCIGTASHLLRRPRVLAALLAATTNAKRALDKVDTRKPYGSERVEA
jgi:phage terminase small subunit